jgi:hypothetical protein
MYDSSAGRACFVTVINQHILGKLLFQPLFRASPKQHQCNSTRDNIPAKDMSAEVKGHWVVKDLCTDVYLLDQFYDSGLVPHLTSFIKGSVSSSCTCWDGWTFSIAVTDVLSLSSSDIIVLQALTRSQQTLVNESLGELRRSRKRNAHRYIFPLTTEANSSKQTVTQHTREIIHYSIVDCE